MDNEEHRREIMSSCSMAAEDCIESASYAKHGFAEGDEENGKMHLQELERRIGKLRAYFSQLSRYPL